VAKAGANYDVVVIGGGINGTGIARDAAGRGLSVLLVEKDDLASATSSWSSKLIHGGLRYLEHFEFRLVAEALAEREVLLNIAPHLVRPLQFVMPHVPELRPRWMIRTGLFLYDHLGRRATKAGGGHLPASHAINLAEPPYCAGLKSTLKHGFVYSDCRVDDARLVLANAVSAAESGAAILTRTACIGGKRNNEHWEIRLRTSTSGETTTVTARALVNATGPWVKQTLNGELHQPSNDNIRLVKGSHIVVPRLYAGEHAFILQNDDRRVVFMIPYEDSYTLIGTTDIPLEVQPAVPVASNEEIEYLCRAVNRYLAKPIAPDDVVCSYAGVRPLYDDGNASASAVTRDYTLRVDTDKGSAPVLSVFGGKITTYRKLAEQALQKLAPWFPDMKPAWTATTALPGGEAEATAEYSEDAWNLLPAPILDAMRKRHGSRVAHVLLKVKTVTDLGTHFGAQLYAREIDYMIEHEWALTGDDILYRRSKAGLHLSAGQCKAVQEYIARGRRTA
jgi:glycerol-3-phosphate dehydrogenase